MTSKSKGRKLPAGKKVVFVEMTTAEKYLVRDANREIHLELVRRLRKMGATDEFFSLFNDLLFLESQRETVVYGQQPIPQIDYEHLMETSRESLAILGVEIHPIDPQGYVANPEPERSIAELIRRLEMEAPSMDLVEAAHTIVSLNFDNGDKLPGWIKDLASTKPEDLVATVETVKAAFRDSK